MAEKEKEFESALVLVIHFESESGEYVLLRGNLERGGRESHRPYQVGRFSTVKRLFLMFDDQSEMFGNYAKLTFGLSDNLPEERKEEVEKENKNKKPPYIFRITKVSLLKSS